MGEPGPQDLSAFAEAAASKKWLSGKVYNLVKYGAFVEVTAPDGKTRAAGLAHKIKVHAALLGKLQVGQEVVVRVCKADLSTGRLEVSMKAKEGYDSKDASEE